MNAAQTDSGAEAGASRLATPRDIAAIGVEFGGLFGRELQLAAGDVVRSAVLVVCVPPLLLLAWTGLCALLGWLTATAVSAAGWGGAAGFGIALFSALQLVALALIRSRIGAYLHSLSLPRTRRQVESFVRALQDEPKSVAH